jgi:folate-dependent phosphoribosylglycinamide formyltransferase PurN
LGTAGGGLFGSIAAVMSSYRMVVIAGPDPSDIYFTNQMIKTGKVVGVFVEMQFGIPGKYKLIKSSLGYAGHPLALIGKVFSFAAFKYYAAKARRIALAGFGREGVELIQTRDTEVVFTRGAVAINAPYYVERISALQPNIIAVCGGPLLKEPVLRITPNIVNLHTGLSQAYRGLWTTLWAIYNNEPKYVGYTIHFIGHGIDDGDIICQGRPVICEDDNHETLHVKVVQLGTKAMLSVLDDIHANRVRRSPLHEKGDIYLGSMVTAEIIRRTWKKIRSGLIREYIKNPKEVELIGL